MVEWSMSLGGPKPTGTRSSIELQRLAVKIGYQGTGRMVPVIPAMMTCPFVKGHITDWLRIWHMIRSAHPIATHAVFCRGLFLLKDNAGFRHQRHIFFGIELYGVIHLVEQYYDWQTRGLLQSRVSIRNAFFISKLHKISFVLSIHSTVKSFWKLHRVRQWFYV